METRKPLPNERQKLLEREEDHFFDLKSYRIAPATLQESFVSFANADGGELYVGVEDKDSVGERIVGFPTIEAANDTIYTLLEQTSPSVENVDLEFIDFKPYGFVLHISIPKSPKVHYTAKKECFVRINARKSKIQGDRITQLAYSKGVYSYEKQAVTNVSLDDIKESKFLDSYRSRISSELEPEVFLRKQRLLSKSDDTLYPNVGCVLLFDEEPQASLDTRCAVKVYRLRTSEKEYRREQLDGAPKTINGPVEVQVKAVLDEIGNTLHGASFHEGGKLVKLQYPAEAIKEIVVNAVIHRDYSLNDDVHIRIYDNRIEVQSPGRLPGYITRSNIYDERFSRNPNLVRLLHNLPNPLNHDIGEGLNTAKNELRKAGLVEPEINELENAVVVVIKHQRLATLEDIILSYLRANHGAEITNKVVRELSGEDDLQKIKKAFQKLRRQGLVVPVDENASAFNYRYVLKE